MNLALSEKISEYDFISSFIEILKQKGITEININELKYLLNYFSLFEKYQHLFNNIYPKVGVEKAINILCIIGYIFRLDTNPDDIYLTGNKDKEVALDSYIISILDELSNDFISLINSEQKINGVNLINPNQINYRIISGIYASDIIKWDLITDGNISYEYDIPSKNYLKDIRNENTILILDELKAKKVVLKNASFVIKQGIINDSVLKNILYAQYLGEIKSNDISKYFDYTEIDNPKIKRISL